jgi:NAD(P)-dependent dehydrogenase (short-subunit alcohol dehydrogenase family)
MATGPDAAPTVWPEDGFGPLLTGRVAVVTGAGAGIGEATARLFARHGATVVVAEIDDPRGNRVADEIVASGGRAQAWIGDVRRVDQVAALRDRVLADHGAVDVLVNNVGHWVAFVGDFVAGGPEHWDALYQVNLGHVLSVTHAFLASMIERGSGSIVNVSSIEGMRGYPVDPVYGAFKAAVVQFTRSLGIQIGHTGVRVNGIGPDVTETRQVPYSKTVPAEQAHLWPYWVPVGRMGVPEDQARIVLFLASDLSGFVTGHTIPTDGGTGAAGGWFRTTEPEIHRTWTNRPPRL